MNGLIAVDMTTKAVKLLQLDKIKGNLGVRAWAYAHIEQEGKIINTLNEARKRLGSRTREAGIALADDLVLSKIIELPVGLTEDEYYSQACLASQTYFDKEDFCLDYEVLSYGGHQPERMRLLIVAAKRDLIKERIDMLHEVGLRACFIGVFSHTLVCALKQLCPGQNPAAIVHCGLEKIMFCVQHNREIVYCRIENYSKKNNLMMICDAVVQQVQLFASTGQSLGLKQIFLTGDCENLFTLKNHLIEKLSYQINILNPFIEISNTMQLQTYGPKFAACFGLALRGLADER